MRLWYFCVDCVAGLNSGGRYRRTGSPGQRLSMGEIILIYVTIWKRYFDNVNIYHPMMPHEDMVRLAANELLFTILWISLLHKTMFWFLLSILLFENK